MIPFDFEYYKPTSRTEAVEAYHQACEQGKKVIFFNGGTEFITFARLNKMKADTVIDLKGISECNVLELQKDELVIGAAVPLNKISKSKLFPLLGETVRKIADHTSRNKITIGGNLSSSLMYREGLLPLLLTEAKVKIAGKDGEEVQPLKTVFQQKMNINPDQFLMQIMIDRSYLDLPFISLKKTKSSKIGYPLVTAAAIKKDKQIRIALSGVCDFPFRSEKLEDSLNNHNETIENRISNAMKQLPSAIVDDFQGLAGYREFVLKNMLEDVVQALEGNEA